MHVRVLQAEPGNNPTITRLVTFWISCLYHEFNIKEDASLNDVFTCCASDQSLHPSLHGAVELPSPPIRAPCQPIKVRALLTFSALWRSPTVVTIQPKVNLMCAYLRLIHQTETGSLQADICFKSLGAMEEEQVVQCLDPRFSFSGSCVKVPFSRTLNPESKRGHYKTVLFWVHWPHF